MGRNKKTKMNSKTKRHVLNDTILYWRKGGKMVWGIIGVVIAISGVSITWFHPKVSVAQNFAPDLKNILSTQFEIKNESNISIENVEFSIAISNIRTSDGLTINGDRNFKGRLKEPNTKENKKIPIMKSGEVNTVQFPSNFYIGNNIEFVDLAIVVNYRIPFLPFWNWKTISRFNTVKGSDGKLYWRGQPLSK